MEMSSLESLDSSREVWVAHGCAWSNSYTSFVLSKLAACFSMMDADVWTSGYIKSARTLYLVFIMWERSNKLTEIYPSSNVSEEENDSSGNVYNWITICCDSVLFFSFFFFFNLKSKVQVTNLISLICLFTPNGNKQESARSPTERA